MLVEDSFIFLPIPRCATVSFESSLLEQGFKVKYYGNDLVNRRIDKGQFPIFHSHHTITDLRKLKPEVNQLREIECVSIYREPVDRFISAWKYVLKNIKDVDENSYVTLKDIDNESFIKRMDSIISTPFDLSKYSTFDKFLGPFIGYDITNDPKFNNSRRVFEAVLTPPSRWHENDVTIRYFDIKHLESLEKYVKEMTNKDFKMNRVNDTHDIETSLVLNDDLKDFYFRKIEVPQKTQKSII